MVGVVLLGVLLLAALWAAAPARANIFQPTRYDDPVPDGCAPNDCSLREAIIAANANPGGDQIFLQPGTYSLTRPRLGAELDPEMDASGGDLDVATGQVLEISGLGTELTAIESGHYPDVQGIDRVFDIPAGAYLRLEALTVRNGRATIGVSNHGHGGGIHNHGHVDLYSVALSDNQSKAGWGGGGLTNAGGARAYLQNVTVVANQALDVGGAGIENRSLSTPTCPECGLILEHVSIGLNWTPFGVGHFGAGLLSSGTTSFWNTIVAENFAGGNCLLTATAVTYSQGYNLSGDDTCPLAGTGDITPAAGQTIALNYQTLHMGDWPFIHALALQSGSPAIDVGDPGGCGLFDQLALGRPQDGDANGIARCDIGAYERDGAPVVTEVVPAADAVGVSVGTNVLVRFNEGMDQASAEAAFSLRRSGSATGILGAFTWNGRVMTFDPVPALDKDATYVATVGTGASDLAGAQMLTQRSWSFQTVQSLTRTPVSVTVELGKYLAGDHTSLAANDDVFFRVQVDRSLRALAWKATFASVSPALSSLTVELVTRYTRNCTQRIAVWNTTTDTWDVVDQRLVQGLEATTTVNVADPQEYVDGQGRTAVLVGCGGQIGTSTSADQLRILFDAP